MKKCTMESMVLFVDARRALLGLWPLMIELWEATQERFYKSSREYKVLESLLCRCSPVRSIQSQADGAACRYADRHGDDLFKTVVDGQQLDAVTKWFYGGLSREEEEEEEGGESFAPRPKCTKEFSAEQLLLLEAVDAQARTFFDRVDALQLIDRPRLRAEARRWDECFARARVLILLRC